MNSRAVSHILRRPVRPRIKVLWTSNWVCKSCRADSLVALRHLETLSSAKPYYITTPIFYVNAAPHVGHLYTMVLTDILKRWQILRGKRAILCTGTDEHGMKIQQAALRAKTQPEEFCEAGAVVFKTLARRANLSNDHFIRTTDSDHKEAVRHIWAVLKAKGYIYASKHEGWYSVSDETFYPESAIEKRLDPFSGRTFMASCETKKEVEWTSEPNYHFRLSAFKDTLLEFYRANPRFVVPESRMNEVVRWVSGGLEDLSVSRPVERLSWGVRVPDDEGQTIYVWLDALVNYITKAGYPWAPGNEEAGGWPADVQVIGKDIVRFHCVYWPAFLFALDIPPPKQILTHAHWTLGKEKMAKSTGNVVNPFFALDRFGVDVMRYYLAHDGGIVDDADYENSHIVEKYRKGLQGGLGNLVSRITKSTMWNVRESVEAAHAGTLLEPDDSTLKQIELLESVRDAASASFDQLNPGAALHHIMDVVYETNKYLQLNAPWILVKTKLASDAAKALRTIYYCAEAIRIVGILLQPYMPGKSETLLGVMGVEGSKRTFDDARLGADSTYGFTVVSKRKGTDDVLFPPLPVED